VSGFVPDGLYKGLIVANIAIGPTFSAELRAAGLFGLPLSWSSDGSIAWGDGITDSQRTAVEAVLAAHNPATPDPTRIAARRYKAEVGGIIWSGWPVATDRDSQAKINAAYVMAKDGHWPARAGWKFADDVYRPLTAEQVQEMALAVAAHVQTCFAVEAAKLADPASDIETGWPD
jgi:hypothetical protein